MEQYKPVALVTQILVLGVTGIAFLIWMGVNGWQDTVGSSMGGIFILLALLQGGFSFIWWRQVRKEAHYDVSSEQDMHDVKLTTMTSSKA